MLTIVALVGGGVAAWMSGPTLKPFMLDLMDGDDGKRETFFNFVPVKLVADVSAYAAVFVAVFVVLTLLSHLIAKGVRGIGLGPADRGLGIAFGLARGMALIVLLFILFTQMTEKGGKNYPEWMEKANTLPMIEKSADWARQFLPKDDKKKKEEVPASDLPSAESKAEEKPAENAAPAEPKTDDAAPPAPAYDDKARELMQNLIEQGKTQ